MRKIPSAIYAIFSFTITYNKMNIKTTNAIIN